MTSRVCKIIVPAYDSQRSQAMVAVTSRQQFYYDEQPIKRQGLQDGKYTSYRQITAEMTIKVIQGQRQRFASVNRMHITYTVMDVYKHAAYLLAYI